MKERKIEYYLSTPLERIKERIDFLRKNQFHPEIRLSHTGILSRISNREVGELREQLEENSLSTFTHAPFFGLDVASIDSGIAKYSMDILTMGAEVSSALGAGIMVIHTGFLPQFSRYGRKLWFSNWRERMPPLIRKASRMGVRLALENTWDHRPEIMEWLIHPLKGEEVGVCIDTGHLNVFSEASLIRWWELLGDRVVAVHLHDNDGLSDDHIIPGRGTFEFESFARLLAGRMDMPLLDFELTPPQALKGREYMDRIFAEISGGRVI